jgi:hypothetical protein
MSIHLRCHSLRSRLREELPRIHQQPCQGPTYRDRIPHHPWLVRGVLPRRALGVVSLVCPTQEHWRLDHSAGRTKLPQALDSYRLGPDGYRNLAITFSAEHVLEQTLHVGWPQQFRRVPYARNGHEGRPRAPDLRIQHCTLLR